MTDGVFTETTQNTPVYVDQLVGEGKKYSNLEALAKSRLDADNYIEQLKKEASEAREELTKRLSVEDAIKKFQSEAQTPVPGVQTSPAATPAIDDNSLIERIRKVNEDLSAENRYKKNVTEAAEKVIEVYGDQDKANSVIKAKAAELGVSVKFLQDTAAQSPSAFYNLIGLERQPTSTPAVTRSDVNVEAFRANSNQTTAKSGTYAYYEEMRKADPTRYFTVSVQNRLMKEALEKGDAFFN